MASIVSESPNSRLAAQTSVSADSGARAMRVFALTAAGIMATACLLAGWAPIGFSIVTVFLFAGPHNWLEARYMLTRMPGRWGPLRGYFLTGIIGVLALTSAFALLPKLDHWLNWGSADFLTALAVWNTSLVIWITVLVLMRSQQNPRRNWEWFVPISFMLIAANWLWPQGFSMSLVYLHPLLALLFFDRELARQRSPFQPIYRACLLLTPLCLGLLWWNLAGAPDLPGHDVLTRRITYHAGGGTFSGVSTHCLVATHTFLEMLHYGVWIIAIPLLSVRRLPWQIQNVPLARRSPAWKLAVYGVVGLGALVVVALWAAFLSNYPLTRDVYFTVAMLHVLAEAPFLLRLL